MNILDEPELIQSIDTYELQLTAYKEIVPNMGISVLQQDICLDNILHKTALNAADLLALPSPGTGDKVTLTRERSDELIGHYYLTLINASGVEALPRLSSTRFARLGGAIAATSYLHDIQGRKVEYTDPPKRLQKVHAGLASAILLSQTAQNKIQEVWKRRSSLLALIEEPGNSPAEKKRLSQALENTMLK